jgi:hypothetical protein
MDVIGGVSAILVIIITFLFIFALFMVFREVFTWYWKINKMVLIQQRQLVVLLKLLEKQGGTVNWDSLKEITGWTPSETSTDES